jgi:two-component system LytT family response regulator
VLRVADVDWIGGAGNYVELHVGPARHLDRQTLAGLESRLDRRRFARIHRSTIVNLERVAAVEARGGLLRAAAARRLAARRVAPPPPASAGAGRPQLVANAPLRRGPHQLLHAVAVGRARSGAGRCR